jgi:hypothetical protein
MFIALRAATTNGLYEEDAAFLDSNDGHRFVPPRNPVIAPKVPWL